MIQAQDVGGVHVKYLYHCRRQLWLYLHGIRPERLSPSVQLGEAVHDTSYIRHSPVDLGSAKLDFVDGQHWVHEVKSSSRPTPADKAQVRHYCYRLKQLGVGVQGGILHYPKTRRTQRHPYTAKEITEAESDIRSVLEIAASPKSPERLTPSRCRGCSFTDYCWTD